MTYVTQYNMLPPGARATTTTIVNGRSYTCALGSILSSVPSHDADTLESNGWVKSYLGGVGTTAQRPNSNTAGQFPLPAGHRFHDTTIAADIVWDGATWRNPKTGAAV